MSDAAAFIDLAERLADAARPLILKYFRSGVDYDVKADASPVTVADREAEAVMRGLIKEAFPDHGILGEEHGAERLDAPYVWVLDPIDGTKSFVTGKPLFGTLIALLREDRPIVGVIDMPVLNERWLGAEGMPTTFNGVPAKARSCDSLDRAWLYATSPQMFRGTEGDAFERLRSRCYASVWGADRYAYGLLASVWTHLVCEASLQPYDYCALVPVIEGAGGVITGWRGEPLRLKSEGRALAAGDPALHAMACAALTDA